MSKLLRRVMTWWELPTDDLITGVVGPEKKGGWSAFWIGDGACPRRVKAPTLTQVADQAASAVAALYARTSPIPGAELALAIYPWTHDGGPILIFDIDGYPGSFTARDIQGSDRMVNGATLEDLVAAVEHMPDIRCFAGYAKSHRSRYPRCRRNRPASAQARRAGRPIQQDPRPGRTPVIMSKRAEHLLLRDPLVMNT
jgi:hypothetical protein